MTDNEVSWCTDCQDYLPVSEFDQSELKKRSRHHRRCRVHAKAHLEWKKPQHALIQRAQRQIKKGHKPPYHKMLKAIAKAARSEAEYNLALRRYTAAVGEAGLKYVKFYSDIRGGEKYAEALPKVRSALTPPTIRKIAESEGIAAVLFYLQRNGPWWPSDTLGPQPVSQHDKPHEVVKAARRYNEQAGGALKALAMIRAKQEEHAHYATQIGKAANAQVMKSGVYGSRRLSKVNWAEEAAKPRCTAKYGLPERPLKGACKVRG